MKAKRGLNVIRFLYVLLHERMYVHTSLYVGSDRKRREDPKNSITLVTCWADLFCLRVEDVPVNVKSFFLIVKCYIIFSRCFESVYFGLQKDSVKN